MKRKGRSVTCNEPEAVRVNVTHNKPETSLLKVQRDPQQTRDQIA
jgi:hypothetical protein